MQFFQANPRRRRVLADDLAAGDAAAVRTVISPHPRSHRRIDGYAPGAKPEQQRRISEFVPNTRLAFGLWFAAGVTVIGCLAAGQIWLPAITSRISTQAAVSLELGATGSLASWIASLWLGLAGVLSLLIYSIRRHKLDDYRGRYRWWIVGGTYCACNERRCDEAFINSSPRRWFMPYGIRRAERQRMPRGGWDVGASCFAHVSARLAWEMRVCRPAMTAYLSAVALWICGLLIQITGVRLGLATSGLPAEIAKLLGHLSLLLGLSIYARHVILHAQGLLPTRKRRNAKEKPVSPVSSKARTDLQPHVMASSQTRVTDKVRRRPKKKSELCRHISIATRIARTATAVQQATENEQDEQASEASVDDRDSDPNLDSDQDGGQNGKLSKAERKRLRKLKAQDEQGW